MKQIINTKNILQRNQTTCVRGISVLLITIFHVLLEFDLPRYINLTGSVCVAAFLFLSGFGINESYKKSGLDHYWYKRFKRIILPYTLFITILIPFTPQFSWKVYLFDISYIHSSYWFIEFLVWNYLLYWITQRFFKKFLFIIFVLFGILGLHFLMQMEAEQCFSFLSGIMASKNIDKLRQKHPNTITHIVIVSFFYGLFFLLLKEIPFIHSYKGTVVYNYILLMIKLPMAISLILLPNYVPILLKSRIFYLCGICSFEIYLVHLSIIDFVTIDNVHLFLYIIFTVIFSYIFYQFNNKVIMRWI